MELRYYQRDAVAAAYRYCQDHPDRNPCIVLPTGAGKTHVIVQICQDVIRWGGRVLVLAHVKELLEQTSSKLRAVDGLDLGIYSAGLKRRDTEHDVIVAGVQSVYTRGFELSGSRPFGIVIVDEAHRIPVDGDGMYVQLLSDLKKTNPKIRVIGLTATPYRTADGYVCSDSHFLNAVCYEASIKELIAGKYLSQLISKRSVHEVDMTGTKIASGDYAQHEMESRFLSGDKVSQAVAELIEYTRERRKVLVFCCGVEHAHSVWQQLSQSQTAAVITGDTPANQRAETLDAFSRRRIKYLVNVNVLTEGFDAPDIDAVVLLRATVSPGLYYQMVGRGLRTHEGKENCLVLDYGGNVQRHGPIDCLKVRPKDMNGTGGEAPVKACPECQSLVHAGVLFCPDCQHEFPPRLPNHEATAGTDSPLGGESIETLEVTHTEYSVHRKRGADETTPRTLRVTYYDGYHALCDEWICVEHTGFAYEKAFAWWFTRSNMPMPKRADVAVELAKRGALAEPSQIKVKKIVGDRFPKIVSYALSDKPAPLNQREPGDDDVGGEDYSWLVDEGDEVPF